MEENLIIEKTKAFIKERLNGEVTGHDYYHTERVFHLAHYIAKHEFANSFIVSLSALLHDVADHKFHQGNSEIGANIAKDWLESLGIEKTIIKKIQNIIRTISFKAGTNQLKQDTLEGMVVQDADRLDAIGAIGIARCFAYGGNKNREIYNPLIKPKLYDDYTEYINTENHSINHFYEKLLLIKDLMNTDTGKKLALKRHDFMENYLKEFYKEWESHELD